MSSMSRRQFVTVAATACACMLCPDPLLAATTEATGPVAVGALKDFARDGVVDTFARSNGFFLIRQQGRLYASSSACTHKNGLLNLKSEQFVCPKHGSQFTFTGAVAKGPARRSLSRYGISADAQGKVTVDLSQRFEEPDWTNPVSFVSVT